uniref:TOG domain-containing protein n=1 Tax=Panagrellus redivivus TaxID=6233 RepID=A0A7E4W4U3_PANRE
MVFIQKKPRASTTPAPKPEITERAVTTPKPAKKPKKQAKPVEEPTEATPVEQQSKPSPAIGQKRPASNAPAATPTKPAAKSKKNKKQKRAKTNPNNAVAPKTFVPGTDCPQIVKDLFYDLASVKPEVRAEAVDKVVKVALMDTAEQYIIGRLIAGCATGYRAARLAFPAALALRLAKSEIQYNIDYLLNVAHDRLKVVNGVNDQVIGRQCVYAAIINSGRFTTPEDLLKILKLEAEAFKKYPYLGYYIVETVGDIAEIAGADTFFHADFSAVNLLPKVLPNLKDISPELLYLVLRLRKLSIKNTGKLGNYLKKGNFVFKPADYPDLIRVVMEATAVGVGASPLPTELYKAAIEAGCSKAVFEQVFLKALNFDLSKKEAVTTSEKSVEHGTLTLFRLVTEWLADGVIPTEEALTLLAAKAFLRRLNGVDANLDVPVSPVNGTADLLLQAALKYFTGRSVNATAAYEVLNTLATIGEAEPTSTLQRLKATKQLLVVFESIMDTIVDKLLKNPASPLLHHVLEAFPGSHPKLDLEKRIELLIAGGEEFLRNSQGLVTEVLTQSFYKPDRHSDFRTYKDTAVAGLHSVAKKIANLDLKEPKGKLAKQLGVLNTTRALLAILEKLAVEIEDKATFYALGKELASVVASKKVDIDFIVGKAVELVGGRERISRMIAYVWLTEFADLITSEQIQVLSATVAKIEADPDTEEDDEFAPITAEDLANLEKKKAANAEEDEEDDTDEESEEDNDSDDELPPLKPEFVAAMKKALGKAAIANSDDEDVALDDAELARVDARLSVVMSQFSTAGKKAAKEESKKQRFHIGELLGIALQAAPMEQVVASFPVIFDLLIAASESNRDDIITPVSHAIGQLCTRTPILEAELSPFYNTLAEKAAEIHGAKLRTTVSRLATFLFKAGLRDDTETAVQNVVNLAEKYFDKETPKSAVGEVIIGPVAAKNVQHFYSHLDKFFDLFTTTNKKGEAATLIKLFNRKDSFIIHSKHYDPVAKKMLAHFNVQPNPQPVGKPSKLCAQAWKVFGNRTNFAH